MTTRAEHFEAEAARLREELGALGAALGEPCAECGHIDWRSDGYADALLSQVKADRELLFEAHRAAEARCARLEAERNEYAERLQWLRDLREREGSWGKPYERAMAASDPRGGEPYQCEEERDRLQERCARLQQALADVREARRRIISACIAVKGKLDQPYPDDERWTPWTRFVEPALRRLDEALAGLDTPADRQEDKT